MRTRAPLCFLVLGRDGVVLGREGKKLEIKLVEPLDELVVEVEELPFEFNLPDGVYLKPTSEFE